MTRKLLEAGKLPDLLILDHIILTKCGDFSFGDEGLIAFYICKIWNRENFKQYPHGLM
ncbi:hypothetical protein ACSBL2_00380 [Pedobacter sp. AW31-3R]|uniref:hypothetical protein n=1 Tax=Pedobacter sp. AW31-3R TaxID=3445781 RepID=UPI003F9F4F5B